MNTSDYKTSGEALTDITALVDKYKRLVEEEIKHLSGNGLVSLANRRSSNWSGGNSATNMAEQIVREACLEAMSNHITH